MSEDTPIEIEEEPEIAETLIVPQAFYNRLLKFPIFQEEEPKVVEKPTSAQLRPKPTTVVQSVDAYNAMIYDLYVHGDFTGCKSLIGVR